MSKIVVITGANRGIGLALATAFTSAGHFVIATARTPSAAHKLAALPNILGIVKAEMSDLASFDGVAAEIARLAPDGIDELWNVRFLPPLATISVGVSYQVTHNASYDVELSC